MLWKHDHAKPSYQAQKIIELLVLGLFLTSSSAIKLPGTSRTSCTYWPFVEHDREYRCNNNKYFEVRKHKRFCDESGFAEAHQMEEGLNAFHLIWCIIGKMIQTLIPVRFCAPLFIAVNKRIGVMNSAIPEIFN